MSFKEVAKERALTFIEPGPVTLMTTFDGAKNNVMILTWIIPVDFNQNFAISTGPWNYSFRTLLSTGECALCIPGPDMLGKAVRAGAVSGEDSDKFSSVGFTAVKAKTVAAPLIAECIACLECELSDYNEKTGITILHCKRVVVNTDIKDARICHAVGDGTFFADGEKFVLREKMKDKLPPNL